MNPNTSSERSSPTTRRWEVDPSSSMQHATIRGRAAVHIVGGELTLAAAPERAVIRLDLAHPNGAADPATLELTSRSIERGRSGILHFTMTGSLVVRGEATAIEMVLRDCSAHDLGTDAWCSLSGATTAPSRRARSKDTVSLDLLLVPVALEPNASLTLAA